MKTFKTSSNDGTIAILSYLQEPLQGTLISECDNELICAKGIIRPPLVDSEGRSEEDQHVEEAAFGKSLFKAFDGSGHSSFYRVQLVGDQRCGFNYQTALFGLKNPELLIDLDTSRLEKLTALDLLSKEARRKVSVGVPISFLLEDLTPWNLITTFKIDGIRSTVYGSELVPRADKGNSAGVSRFMLLPDTMGRLCQQLNCKPADLYKIDFLLHRDPTLPDGTDLFPAKYAGMLKWNNNEYGQGVVLHPGDSNWKMAGGDFDGDACSVYVKQPFMELVKPICRPNYRTQSVKYEAKTVDDQMLEAAANATPSLLGSTILGMMRLIERGLGDESCRALGAAVAQAAVDSVKHPVNHNAIYKAHSLLVQQIADGRDIVPKYISDYLNNMKRANGVEAKLAVWDQLCSKIDAGWWVDGSPIEQALVRRINTLRSLFEEVKWYRELSNQQIPQNIRQAAVSKVFNTALIEAVTNLTQEYALNTSILSQCSEEECEFFRERIRELRTNAKLLVTTGAIGTLRVDTTMAQYALIAFGPQRLAAQFVPSERFEELSSTSRHLFISLIGTTWQTGTYNIELIKPIPNCVNHWTSFAANCKGQVNVVVLGTAAHSTRVKINN